MLNSLFLSRTSRLCRIATWVHILLIFVATVTAGALVVWVLKEAGYGGISFHPAKLLILPMVAFIVGPPWLMLESLDQEWVVPFRVASAVSALTMVSVFSLMLGYWVWLTLIAVIPLALTVTYLLGFADTLTIFDKPAETLPWNE